MVNQNFTEIADEQLQNAAGGMFSVQAWGQFLSTSIMPGLYRIESSAVGVDYEVYAEVSNTLRATMIPNAQIAVPVRNLQTRFIQVLAPKMLNGQVRAEIWNALESAVNYINTH